MASKRSFKSHVLLTYLAAFSIFAVAIFLFQYNREKDYRTSQLENTLENITSFAHKYIEHNHLIRDNRIEELDTLLEILPLQNERITIIDLKGIVLYDSEVEDVIAMENHLMRPELQLSLKSQKGSSIRKSATTNKSYYYFSVSYPNYFIRTAVLYDLEIQSFLKTERLFIFFLLSIFLIMWLLLRQITGRIGTFVTKLQDVAVSAEKGSEIDDVPNFPDRELDVISKKIVSIYNKLNRTKYDLEVEKTKLFDHLDLLEEGIAFYSNLNDLSLCNKNYIQYLNLISNKTFKSVPNISKVKLLLPIVDYIRNTNSNENMQEQPEFSIKINKSEQYFQVKVVVFKDQSFEVVISNITKLEKRRRLKQQLTSNIAHELKTPVTSIRGYLETIIDNENIPEDKRKHFISRSLDQAERLTHLLNDISLINNIEDAGDLFEIRKIQLRPLVDEVLENMKMNLNDHYINYTIDINQDLYVEGNYSLLISIFQNLIENSIKYAGDNIEIVIRNYHEDQKHYYFSYVDTGRGIPEKHLTRIFERFYRVEESRSRSKGGSGLGLSIVKNAIQLHKGEVSVQNRKEGGVEFLFSLSKFNKNS